MPWQRILPTERYGKSCPCWLPDLFSPVTLMDLWNRFFCFPLPICCAMPVFLCLSLTSYSSHEWTGWSTPKSTPLCATAYFFLEAWHRSLYSWENSRTDFMPLGILLTVYKFMFSFLCEFISFICVLLLVLLLVETLEGRSRTVFSFFAFSHRILSMLLRT